MKIIYIAGPFRADTAWEIEQNVRRAEEHAAMLVRTFAVMPMIPHANTRYFHGLGEDSFWLEGTLELMRRCDAIYLCPGWEFSTGSKGERAEAERLSMPVFLHGEKSVIRRWLAEDG
jgi:hypothetical protein